MRTKRKNDEEKYLSPQCIVLHFRPEGVMCASDDADGETETYTLSPISLGSDFS